VGDHAADRPELLAWPLLNVAFGPPTESISGRGAVLSLIAALLIPAVLTTAVAAMWTQQTLDRWMTSSARLRNEPQRAPHARTDRRDKAAQKLQRSVRARGASAMLQQRVRAGRRQVHAMDVFGRTETAAIRFDEAGAPCSPRCSRSRAILADVLLSAVDAGLPADGRRNWSPCARSSPSTVTEESSAAADQ